MIIHLATTTSTQEEARQRARQGCVHGLVVRADEQSGGRGRRGRSWLSGPHGLWMSMVLRVDLPMARAPRLPLCAAARVVDVLDAALGLPGAVFVKWPNDLLIASTTTHDTLGPFQKIGGLLIEAVDVSAVVAGDAPRLRTAVLGLGINLTTPDGGFPAELAGRAASLDQVRADALAAMTAGGAAGHSGGPSAGLDAGPLCAALQRALVDVEKDADDVAFARVREQLAARSATLRRRVTVDGISGRALSIADDGALVIEDDDGQRRVVHAGDVAVVAGEP